MKINILNGFYYSFYFYFVMTLIHVISMEFSFFFVYVLQLMNKYRLYEISINKIFFCFYYKIFCHSNVIYIYTADNDE